MLDLINGRIDAYIYDEPANEIFVNTKGKGLFHNQMTLFNEPIAIGVRKGETELLYNINMILKQMGETGKLDSLNTKWFVNLNYLDEL
jgi:polar amino acid transport system substrate-binding protein